MSLPRELLDELLSRYMDGELSADELARVEQLLTTDSEARATLDALRSSSGFVRQVVDSSGKLRADFATRVFAAATTEAEHAGLASNHPLMLATSDSARSKAERKGRSLGFKYAGVLAVAASLMLAVFFATQDRGQDQLASETGSQQSGAAENGSNEAAKNDGQAENLLQGLAAESVSNEPATMLADSQTEKGGTREKDGTLNDIAGTDSAKMSEVTTAEQITVDSNPLENSSIVANDSAATLDNLPAGVGKLQAVMVYEVTLTAQGRANNVVARMLKNAGVRVGDEREVDGSLVGHMRDSGLVGGAASELVDEEEGQGKRCQVIFLEGSGLALERAMMGLLAAEGEVSKVGFNLMMNPPVVAALEELKVDDPRQVRAGGSEQEAAVAHSLSPSGYDGPTDAGFALGNQRFMAVNPQQAGTLSQLSAFGNGPKNDIKSQVLVVVRFE